MLRNKMRVRFADKGLSEEICTYLSNNTETAKLLFRANRSVILKSVMEKDFHIHLLTILFFILLIILRLRIKY